MKLRLYSLLLTALLLPCVCFAQTSATTANAVDSDGQSWNNGTYSITFVPPVGYVSNIYTFNGNAWTPTSYTGSLSGSGVLNVSSIPRNDFIIPSGSKWAFKLCPKASGLCSTTTVIVNQATQTLSLALNAPRFPASNLQTGSYGYADSEVQPSPAIGLSYFNVNTNLYRIWTGASWIDGLTGASILSGDTQGLLNSTIVKGINGLIVPSSKTIVGTNSLGQLIDATGFTLPNSISGNAATASQFLNAPSGCTTGVYSTGISINGTANCAQVTYAQLGGSVPIWNQNTTGNAATASQFLLAPTQCSANQYSSGIGANGNSVCSQVNYTQLTGIVPTWNQDTTGNAATSTLATTATLANTATHALNLPTDFATQSAASPQAGTFSSIAVTTPIPTSSGGTGNNTGTALAVGNVLYASNYATLALADSAAHSAGKNLHIDNSFTLAADWLPTSNVVCDGGIITPGSFNITFQTGSSWTCNQHAFDNTLASTISTTASSTGWQVTGSVTSGVFQAGESVLQATTLAIGVVLNAPTGTTTMSIQPIVGSPDATHTWTGLISAAVYTPSSSPTMVSTITVASATGLATGQFVFMPTPVPARATVSTYGGGTTLTMSSAATQTTTDWPVIFRASTTGASTSASAVVTVTSTSGLAIGQTCVGAYGIPSLKDSTPVVSKINSISAGVSVTLSQNATKTTTATFNGQINCYFETTASTVSGSTTLTITGPTAGIASGDVIDALPVIQPGNTIASISGTTVTLSDYVLRSVTSAPIYVTGEIKFPPHTDAVNDKWWGVTSAFDGADQSQTIQQAANAASASHTTLNIAGGQNAIYVHQPVAFYQTNVKGQGGTYTGTSNGVTSGTEFYSDYMWGAQFNVEGFGLEVAGVGIIYPSVGGYPTNTVGLITPIGWDMSQLRRSSFHSNWITYGATCYGASPIVSTNSYSLRFNSNACTSYDYYAINIHPFAGGPTGSIFSNVYTNGGIPVLYTGWTANNVQPPPVTSCLNITVGGEQEFEQINCEWTAFQGAPVAIGSSARSVGLHGMHFEGAYFWTTSGANQSFFAVRGNGAIDIDKLTVDNSSIFSSNLAAVTGFAIVGCQTSCGEITIHDLEMTIMRGTVNFSVPICSFLESGSANPGMCHFGYLNWDGTPSVPQPLIQGWAAGGGGLTALSTLKQYIDKAGKIYAQYAQSFTSKTTSIAATVVNPNTSTNLPASQHFKACGNTTVTTAGSAGTVQPQVVYTESFAGGSTTAPIGSSVALTAAGATQACTEIFTTSGSSISMQTTVTGNTGGTYAEEFRLYPE